jgi:hypothetical protein
MHNNLSILQNFKSRLVQNDPFPHFVIENALPADLYHRLEQQYPSAETIFSRHARKKSELQMESNARYDISAAAVHADANFDIGLWREFVLYHTSQNFLDELLEKLGNTVASRYDWLVPLMCKKSPTGRPRAGVRRYKDDTRECEVALDCQVGMNSPVSSTPSTVKSLHLDNSAELFAGLFYLRDANDTSTGGDLELYRWKNGRTFSFYDKRYIRLENAELINAISYGPNKFVWLLNSLNAIHSVSVRNVTPFPRRLVNIIAEVYPTIDRLFDERPYAEKPRLLQRILSLGRA